MATPAVQPPLGDDLRPSVSPSMFSASSNLTFNGGAFNQYTNVGVVRDSREVIDKAFEKYISLDITHDNDALLDARVPSSTGDAILQKLMQWALDSTNASNVLWLHGPPGVGKTAIAVSFAAALAKQDRLAASFFFPPDDTRDLKRSFMPSLAYQLSISMPEVAQHIADAVRTNPIIFGQSLGTQMKELIVDPILSSGLDTAVNRIVVIDGLDAYDPPGESCPKRVSAVIRDIAPLLEGKLKFVIFSRSTRDIFKELDNSPSVIAIRLGDVLAFIALRAYVYTAFFFLNSEDHPLFIVIFHVKDFLLLFWCTYSNFIRLFTMPDNLAYKVDEGHHISPSYLYLDLRRACQHLPSLPLFLTPHSCTESLSSMATPSVQFPLNDGLRPSISPSMFSASSNLTFNGGVFNQYNNITPAGRNTREAIDKAFERYISLDITHDNDDLRLSRIPPSTSAPILQELMQWALRSVDSPNVVWLHGPAGVGKTAIAVSFAEMLVKQEKLAASFFFPRDDLRNLKRSFVASLAYQMCFTIPELAQHIAEAAERNPMIFGQSLETQMKELIVQPVLSSNLPAYASWIIIIDGLDAYDSSGENCPRLVSGVIRDISPLLQGKLKFFISSKSTRDLSKELANSPVVISVALSNVLKIPIAC
ncbi:hypothetical protein CVT26_004260, partial [Gymnopilus dilepis]